MKLFVTDYASYNEGTQFEFGHWVDLTDFADGESFCTYLEDHFKKADAKRPLLCGSEREEWMFTDYEDFPRELYSESMSRKGIDSLIEFVNLQEEDRAKVTFLLCDGYDIGEALRDYDDVYLRVYDGTNREKWELFEEYYPDAEDMSNKNDYVTIDYDRFIDENFTEFQYNGTTYLAQR